MMDFQEFFMMNSRSNAPLAPYPIICMIALSFSLSFSLILTIQYHHKTVDGLLVNYALE
ncbi:hypothetical protein BDV39DRAFT_180571 [Aspergillus sergii]|uniref:Uncharacterized protein n=1 Tax=Aspergillus sergii TaxID=1034303 RepID=A0A5N6WU56_9EURO|nr:hypothetical protein BDV39DRAFT_180571 [Aspergillus sergii]